MFFIMYGNEPQPMLGVMQSFLKHIVVRTMKQMAATGNPSDFAELIASFFQVNYLKRVEGKPQLFYNQPKSQIKWFNNSLTVVNQNLLLLTLTIFLSLFQGYVTTGQKGSRAFGLNGRRRSSQPLSVRLRLSRSGRGRPCQILC
jgi:hypothetical protein